MSVRLAAVNPFKVSVAPPVTASDVLLSATLDEMLSTSVSVAPFNVPAPVQPRDGEGIAAAPLSVRLAVVMPFDRLSDMPSVDDSKLFVSVKPALLLAATVSAVAAVSVSDPFPVQPLTVKVLPPAVSVRLAVVIPL